MLRRSKFKGLNIFHITHLFVGLAATAGVLMAQREMSFWNPFFFEFKRLAYAAVGAG